MTVELRPLTSADAEAHCAGEDELTVRWLTGGYGDAEGTIEYFEWLASNADADAGVGSGVSGCGCQGACAATSTTTQTSMTGSSPTT